MLSKLTGDVNPAQILELAPTNSSTCPISTARTRSAARSPGSTTWRSPVNYSRNGQARTIAQITAVIPAKGVYVLQINVEGTYGQTEVVIQVLDTIAKKATITV